MIAVLVYTIIEAPNHGWGSARTLGGFALSGVLARRSWPGSAAPSSRCST